MKLKTELWLYGLFHTVITGIATSGAAMWVAPETFNFGDLPKLGKLLMAGAVINLFSYLKKSPLPPMSTGNTEIFTKQP